MVGSILNPFVKFAQEGATIGRLLAGYSTLEIGLMNCVQVALGNFDLVLKTMFQHRGETRRIDEAVKLGLPAYKAAHLENDFQAATDAMRHCLSIRSQYAHWIWWDDNSGQLALANMEDIARIATSVNDLSQLNPSHVSAALLEQQEEFFVLVDHYFAWINYQGRFLSGKIARGLPNKPKLPPPPRLSLYNKRARPVRAINHQGTATIITRTFHLSLEMYQTLSPSARCTNPHLSKNSSIA
jgi:hypothetical protein